MVRYVGIYTITVTAEHDYIFYTLPQNDAVHHNHLAWILMVEKSMSIPLLY